MGVLGFFWVQSFMIYALWSIAGKWGRYGCLDLANLPFQMGMISSLEMDELLFDRKNGIFGKHRE